MSPATHIVDGPAVRGPEAIARHIKTGCPLLVVDMEGFWWEAHPRITESAVGLYHLGASKASLWIYGVAS